MRLPLAIAVSATIVTGMAGVAGLAGTPARAAASARATAHLDLALRSAPGALQASPAMVAATVEWLRSAGLNVTSATTTAVTAAGPPAVVTPLFRPVASTQLGAILTVPQALSGTVSTVVDADDTRTLAHPRVSYDASQLASDYAGAPATGYARTRPNLTPQTPIIASQQLVGFDPQPLTAYAQQVAFNADPGYDPVTMPAGDPQYTAVGVNRPPQFIPGLDTDDNSGEFALDEEAILGAAPNARLRAYVSTADAAGVLSSAERVLSDVLAGAPIIVYSTSWGACEPSTSDNYLVALDDTYHRLSQAGVTVIAASGDSGSHDCDHGFTGPAVDFPASSPNVLGVGGTTHSGGGQPDTAWSEAARGVGSGGGYSAVFYRPAYQAAVGHGTARMVPDISADGDVHTGFLFLPPDHTAPGGVGRPDPVGGTSVAAPLVAAMLANVELAHGFGFPVRGLGDIHRALYTASRLAPGAITDVTTTTDPAAGAVIQPVTGGYDTATGLGVPNWNALAPALYAAAPAPTAGPRVQVAARTPVRAHLGFAPPPGRDAIGWYVSDAHDDLGCQGNPYHPRALVPLPLGRQVLAVHSLGADLVCSQATRVVVSVGRDDSDTARSRGWSGRRNPAAFGGGYLQSLTPRATIAWKRTNGRVYDVLFDWSRQPGVASIYVDGKLARTVRLGGLRERFAVPTTVAARAHGSHTVQVVVVSGTVRVDGLLLHA